jgi:hypothetical protein
MPGTEGKTLGLDDAASVVLPLLGLAVELTVSLMLAIRQFSIPHPLTFIHLFPSDPSSSFPIFPIVHPSSSHIHTLQLRLKPCTVLPLQQLLMPPTPTPLVLNQRYEANWSSYGCGTCEDGGMNDREPGVADVESLLGDAGDESSESAARGAVMTNLMATLDFYAPFPPEY